MKHHKRDGDISPKSTYDLGIFCSGAVDSILAMFVLLSIYYLIKDDLISSGIMFGLSVMTKGYSLPLAVFIGSFTAFKNKYFTSFSMGRKRCQITQDWNTIIIVAISLTIPLITIAVHK